MAGWGLHTNGDCASCRQSKGMELIAPLPETLSITSQLRLAMHAMHLVHARRLLISSSISDESPPPVGCGQFVQYWEGNAGQ